MLRFLAEVGFPDPLHFSRVFRHVTGQAPRQARNAWSPCLQSPVDLDKRSMMYKHDVYIQKEQLNGSAVEPLFL